MSRFLKLKKLKHGSSTKSRKKYFSPYPKPYVAKPFFFRLLIILPFEKKRFKKKRRHQNTNLVFIARGTVGLSPRPRQTPIVLFVPALLPRYCPNRVIYNTFARISCSDTRLPLNIIAPYPDSNTVCLFSTPISRRCRSVCLKNVYVVHCRKNVINKCYSGSAPESYNSNEQPAPRRRRRRRYSVVFLPHRQPSPPPHHTAAPSTPPPVSPPNDDLKGRRQPPAQRRCVTSRLFSFNRRVRISRETPTSTRVAVIMFFFLLLLFSSANTRTTSINFIDRRHTH